MTHGEGASVIFDESTTGATVNGTLANLAASRIATLAGFGLGGRD